MLKKKTTKKQAETQALDAESVLIEEILSLIGGSDISRIEIKGLLEENSFKKDKTIEAILQKRENQKKMTKNLAVKKIQTVSNHVSKQKPEELSQYESVLVTFFREWRPRTKKPSSNITITIPSGLLKEISLNFE